jgi:hypothetical protein
MNARLQTRDKLLLVANRIIGLRNVANCTIADADGIVVAAPHRTAGQPAQPAPPASGG